MVPFVILLLLLLLKYQPGKSAPSHELPISSTEFLASYSCINKDDILLDSIGDTDDTSFFRWVLSARHTTWSQGWEVALPNSNHSSGAIAIGDAKYYARVYDMLNWSREKRLMPVSIDISAICHKGMEEPRNAMYWSDEDDLPTKPNEYIPIDDWRNLWNTCHKQLSSTSRISSSCIDVPGIVVATPDPPFVANNPCTLQYRMVDGAHRMCLRKYLLILLNGELIELEERLAKQSSDTNNIHSEIQQKRLSLDQTKHGSFLELNQTTFQSMLIADDPHTTWAKSKEHLTKGIASDVKLDWKVWMGHVMDHAKKNEREYLNEDSGPANTKEEL